MRIWAPRAARMGLRYVAHVVQADTKRDTITETPRHAASGLFELQIFEKVIVVEEWLRSCQAQTTTTVPR